MIAGQVTHDSFTGWQNLPLGVYCVSKATAGLCQMPLLEATHFLSWDCVCEDGNIEINFGLWKNLVLVVSCFVAKD